MKAPLSRRPQPHVEPISGVERGQKNGGRSSSPAHGEARANRGNSQHCGQAVTGQTPGQLIDLHYVNYRCDVERRMKNGSHCCAILSECTLLSFLLTLKLAREVMPLLKRVCVCRNSLASFTALLNLQQADGHLL